MTIYLFIGMEKKLCHTNLLLQNLPAMYSQRFGGDVEDLGNVNYIFKTENDNTQQRLIVVTYGYSLYKMNILAGIEDAGFISYNIEDPIIIFKILQSVSMILWMGEGWSYQSH
ncbi:hypothetical protein SAY86_020006 [Trapa natans]|uniref:Uncharacterized protein n=1 Tax=Trapa natans TaxID=22666 RepID=A0AAN7R3S2_TRANT|nr:hypothetical protein SAY86_020006 [Trapa natans]